MVVAYDLKVTYVKSPSSCYQFISSDSEQRIESEISVYFICGVVTA